MKDINKAIEWFKQNIDSYKMLAKKVEDVLRENIEQEQIQFHSITNRAKSLESYTQKAKNEKYRNPITEIKDLAGIRVITYLESDVSKVSNIVEGLFDVFPDESIDQSKLLGSNKVGYRSVHYIAELGNRRCALPEYARYKNLPFEIQIRSLLQHAWAEIEHDRNYKFSGKLPTQIERRFYLVAGMLEVADREFTSIADEIEKYERDVSKEVHKGDLDIEINTTSLREYLSEKFSNLVRSDLLLINFGKRDVSKEIVNELLGFGISKLYELDNIIPPDLQDYLLTLKPLGYWNNLASLTRHILIINDAKKYFEICWQKAWESGDSRTLRIFKKYAVDIDYVKKFVDHWVEHDRDDYLE